MTTEPQAAAIAELVDWIEQQLRELREQDRESHTRVEMLQRQLHGLADQVVEGDRAIRAIPPQLAPFKGVPDKIREIEQGSEDLRQAITANKAEVDSALRIVAAEANYDREERSNAIRKIEQATSQLALIAADVAQVQAQASQLSQTMQTLLERQREVESRVDQFELRLERALEVNRDMEQRVRESVVSAQEERFDLVFERLQLVGEMVKRSDEVVQQVAAERSMREEVIQEIAMWRDQHSRIDGRLSTLEESSDRLLGIVDKLHGEITLLEGRHSGLGERVAGIRRDIAEVVDHVRDEFAKYNAMMEKQRRKQIGALEQELREMKFHAFRPPEEP
jgi:chromosome segregation ATPase